MRHSSDIRLTHKKLATFHHLDLPQNFGIMADSSHDPLPDHPPTVCANVPDTSEHGDWDAIEHCVFTEVAAITLRHLQLCDAADKGDASAITQVASLVRLQADLLRASGCSSRAEFIDSILGPNLLDRIRACPPLPPVPYPSSTRS